MSNDKKERLPAETPSETLAEATKGQTVPTAFAKPGPASSAPSKEETKPDKAQSRSPSMRLSYVDPGKERGLPPPVRARFQGGEKVKLTKAQVYGTDGVTIPAGELGFLVNPSSQAACWCVRFPKASPNKLRVVPDWELELVGPAPVGH